MEPFDDKQANAEELLWIVEPHQNTAWVFLFEKRKTGRQRSGWCKIAKIAKSSERTADAR